ncbi:MAG: GNAT family N-acetyltransferase [Oscillospiraceae bacterium]|jgi:RimJ/RimL family protein N-acetyltransferase|nr:GNAT family N-acetyltransferase [Oscillospiraceae bacterium]
MDFVINTERLHLRPFETSDAPALHGMANQPHILKWMPDWKSTLEDTESLIQYFASQHPLACATMARVMFAVTLQDCVMGMVGIGNKKELDNEIEMAYFISEAYAGNGYITEAAQAVSRWALQNLQMDYLIAIVEPDNIPSQRVVEKCGFQRMGKRMVLNAGDSVAKPFCYYRLYRVQA